MRIVVASPTSTPNELGQNEHCSVDAATVRRIGGLGRQVLVQASDRSRHFALLTVTGEYGAPPAGECRVGSAGFARLSPSIRPPIYGYVDTVITRPGEFEEYLSLGAGDEFAVLAPHGGAIEFNTDKQALRLAELATKLLSKPVT